MAMTRAFICGLEGLEITGDERAFLREAQPWGLILFARNCDTPEQIQRLVSAARDAVGSDLPILIDQEGGQVQRLRAPYWQNYPSARQLGALYSHSPDAGLSAARSCARLIAHDLHALGITINCAPVLDVAQRGTHDAIGTRAYSTDPDIVAALAGAVAEGFMEGGVLPVVKHAPGQGRAEQDTHYDVSVVDAAPSELDACDMRPFRALRHLPLAMTCHVVFSAFDDRPVTLSPVVIGDIIRGAIGYDGLLLTDDLSMKALSGTMRSKASDAIAAGCDIALHCNGDLSEAQDVAAAVPELAGQSKARADKALRLRRSPESFDVTASRRSLEELDAA